MFAFLKEIQLKGSFFAENYVFFPKNFDDKLIYYFQKKKILAFLVYFTQIALNQKITKIQKSKKKKKCNETKKCSLQQKLCEIQIQ